ncbi:hypothetical protein HHK36_003148 [Tetracentron sinense]|uniref:SCP domain-containing protein n=1 Tax=Tetracentron sinense TaxID=13715 RepID=A0A834ZX40_TETSI|nr:hypothetical protein HHK36_003148 [Tetracentron sinense]
MGFFLKSTQLDHVLLGLMALAFCNGLVLGLAPVISPPNTTTPVPAPDPPKKLNATEEFLEAHNEARAAVGVGPLEWSQKLASDANRLVRYQRDKKECKFAEVSNGEYGANQLWAGGLAVMPRAVVNRWVEEKEYYNHTNNSCAPDHMCGLYTQLVWKKTLELGCAQATCVKEHVFLTICFYYPPGNVAGESPY